MKKEFIICRGLPGTGKSEYARSIKDGHVFSLDKDLSYEKWDYHNLIEVHHQYQKKVGTAFRDGLSPIVLDSDNILPIHIAPYIKLAKFYNYSWRVYQTCDQSFNQNRVNQRVLEEMVGYLCSVPCSKFTEFLHKERPVDPEICLREAQLAVEKNDYRKADTFLLDYSEWRIRGYEPEGGDDTYNFLCNKVRKSNAL